MTDNLEQLIKEAVEKALEGDMDAINNIEAVSYTHLTLPTTPYV